MNCLIYHKMQKLKVVKVQKQLQVQKMLQKSQINYQMRQMLQDLLQMSSHHLVMDL